MFTAIRPAAATRREAPLRRGIRLGRVDRLFGAPRPRHLHPFREIRGVHCAVSASGDILLTGVEFSLQQRFTFRILTDAAIVRARRPGRPARRAELAGRIATPSASPAAHGSRPGTARDFVLRAHSVYSARR